MKATKITNVNIMVNHLLEHKVLKFTKIFSHANHLRRHIQIHMVHEGHKDYKCASCDKSFSGPGILKRHIHLVPDERKDYKCESCDKSFTSAQYLKKHTHTIHEGDKDHKCESCDKSFSQAHSLKKHIYTVHEGHKL